MPTCFYPQLFICACEYILFFCNLHLWINNIFSHADTAGSFRVSLVVGVHSILGDMVGESLFRFKFLV